MGSGLILKDLSNFEILNNFFYTIRKLDSLKIRKLLKKKFIVLFATTFTWTFFNNYAEATVLNNSYKEVIDHVWQIVYRDFLDSSGKFQKSNWIKLRKDFLSKTYSGSNEAYDAIRDMPVSYTHLTLPTILLV